MPSMTWPKLGIAKEKARGWILANISLCRQHFAHGLMVGAVGQLHQSLGTPGRHPPRHKPEEERLNKPVLWNGNLVSVLKPELQIFPFNAEEDRLQRLTVGAGPSPRLSGRG